MRFAVGGALALGLSRLLSAAAASRSDGVSAVASLAAAEASLALLRSDCQNAAVREVGHHSDGALDAVSRCVSALQQYAAEAREHGRLSTGRSRSYTEDVKAMGALAEKLAADMKAGDVGFRSGGGRQRQELDGLIDRLAAVRASLADGRQGSLLASRGATTKQPEGGEPCPGEQALEETEREVEYLRQENSRLAREKGRRDTPPETAGQTKGEKGAFPDAREDLQPPAEEDVAEPRRRVEVGAKKAKAPPTEFVYDPIQNKLVPMLGQEAAPEEDEGVDGGDLKERGLIADALGWNAPETTPRDTAGEEPAGRRDGYGEEPADRSPVRPSPDEEAKRDAELEDVELRTKPEDSELAAKHDVERRGPADELDSEVAVRHDVERRGGADELDEEEADDREARLVEQVTRQAAEVARISRELRVAEGNGKRTVDDVEAERRDKAAEAEDAARQLDEQRAAFAQAQEIFEKAGNQTAQQRQITTRAEEEHKRTLAAYQRERQRLDRLRGQVEEAEDAATRAEATRTETERKVGMDTSELKKELATINRLSDELNGVQAKEKNAAAAAEREDAGSKDADDVDQSEEGIFQKILETVGLAESGERPEPTRQD